MPITVAEIMSRDVRTCHEGTSLAEAAKEVAGGNIRHLVMVDLAGLPTGVFSQRNMLRELALSFKNKKLPEQQTLKRLCSKKLITTKPDTPLHEAAGVLAKHKIGCLPVVAEDGQLMGIVTVVDVLEYVAKNGEQAEMSQVETSAST